MENKAELLALVEADLAPFPLMRDACRAIVEGVVSEQALDLDWLSFGMLARLSRVDDTRLLLQAVQYLSGSRAHVLDVRYVLVDDEVMIPLEGDYVDELVNESTLHHPDTGEIVEDPRSKVVLTFGPSQMVRELVAAK